jgi:hypothetical protein
MDNPARALGGTAPQLNAATQNRTFNVIALRTAKVLALVILILP